MKNKKTKILAVVLFAGVILGGTLYLASGDNLQGFMTKNPQQKVDQSSSKSKNSDSKYTKVKTEKADKYKNANSLIESVSFVSSYLEADSIYPVYIANNISNGWNNVAILRIETNGNLNVPVNLGEIIFNLNANNASLDSTDLFNDGDISLERISGTTGSAASEIEDLDAQGDSPSFSGEISFDLSSVLGVDKIINPGDTAYFLLKSNIHGLDGQSKGAITAFIKTGLESISLNNGSPLPYLIEGPRIEESQ